ncbi:MAG TPA: copper resistance protein CopC [Gaiellaceae bacterium]|nr:copper resistance protein CopC [Gaiellaceae bacterium]
MKRAPVLALAVAVALTLPAAARAHAALLKTVPSASGTVNASPKQVTLTFTEPVEPRFAIVSVTDAGGAQVTSGEPRRAAGAPQTLVTPLRTLAQGWYLVFWRTISADGHPVRGAFTFAVGPSAGPPPRFQVPSLSETATTTRLLVMRWLVFLALLAALGLFVLRTVIARPVVRAVRGCSLRPVTIAFWIALLLALAATPVYVLLATAQFTLRSFWDLGSIVPAARGSGFGRDFLDLELVLALFGVAAGIALAVDRPEREQRSVVELLALPAALAAGLATLVLPALAGHAGQKAPRGLSLPLDTAHLGAAAVWLGGLIGIVVFWLSVGRAGRAAALAHVVPRFSAVAFCSVLLLIGTGVGQSLQELPTLPSLWQTSYGQALLWKIGLLAAALVLAGVNLARTKPRLQASDASAPLLLRRLVQGEIVFVAAALFAAGVLASLAPPSSALARVRDVSARVGPGAVSEVVSKPPYRVRVRVTPNRAAVANTFSLSLTRDGKPVRGAAVVTRFDMLDMQMGEQSYRFREVRPGVFARSAPALVMVGHWGLLFEVTPPGGKPFVVTLLDKASG